MRILLLSCFILISLGLKAQTPSTCFEIESILIDACVPGGGCTSANGFPDCSCEGKNEMVRFRVGPSDLNISDLTVDWPNNSYQGIYPPDLVSDTIVDTLNSTISSCGWLVEPTGGVLPAGAQVLLITSIDMCMNANSFTNLQDTLYIIFQNAGNNTGHFANFNVTPGTRTLIMDFNPPGASCADTVSYDRSLISNSDGARADFEWDGTITYTNGGCQAPFVPLDVILNLTAAGNDTVCFGDSLQFDAKITGSYKDIIWNGGTGSFSNANTDTTFYTPSSTDTSLYIHVDVINNCNDTVSDSVLIRVIHPISISTVINGSDSICEGDSVALSVSGSLYAYLWNTGSTSDTIWAVITDTFIVSSVNFCFGDTDSVAVYVFDSLKIDMDSISATFGCVGDSVLLEPYITGYYNSLLWSGGTGSFNNSSGDSTWYIPTGSESSVFLKITASDFCGNTVEDSVALTMDDVVSANITSSGNDTICSGNSTMLYANVTNASHIWNTFSFADSISVSSSGSYSIAAANLCFSDFDTLDIVVLSTPLLETDSINGTYVCSGDSILLEPYISGVYSSLSWTGGSGVYSDSSSDSTWYIPGTSDSSFYTTLNLTDFCGSLISDSTVLAMQDTVIAYISLTGSDTICPGDSAVLKAWGGLYYLWSTGDTINQITVLSAGTYGVTVSNDCFSVEDSMVIQTISPPIASLTYSPPTPLCAGDSVLITAGGAGNYSWSTGAVGDSIYSFITGNYILTVTNICGSDTAVAALNFTDSIGISTTLSLDSICSGDSSLAVAFGNGNSVWSTGSANDSTYISLPGTYYVTVSNSCFSEVDSVTVSTSSANSISINQSGIVQTCNGDSVVAVASGSAPVITWSNGIVNDTLFATSTGTYYAIGSGSCPNDTSGSFTVQALPGPSATLNNLTFTICQGDSAQIIAGGGSSYIWSTGSNNTSIYANTSGVYIVTVSNSCGTDVASATVSMTGLPSSQLNANGSTSICQGDSITFTASGNYNFLWSTGETSAAITIYNAGTYAVSVSNSCGTDVLSDSVSFISDPVPSIGFSGDTSVCPGDVVQLSTSNTGSFVWSTGETTSSITANDSGLFYLSITGSCSTVNSDTINVIWLDNPQLTGFLSDVFVCPGEEIILTAPSSGLVIWNGIDTTQSFTVTEEGGYAFTASNSCGTVSDSVYVTEDDIYADFTPSPEDGLFPLEVIFNNESSGADDHVWEFGNGTSSTEMNPTVTFINESEFNVLLIVTSDSGCVDSLRFTYDVAVGFKDIFIPNVFSPNNDGFNDVFTVKAVNIAQFEGIIMNRWGTHIYTWNAADGSWDGRDSNGEVNDGVYFYIINITWKDGSTDQYRGDVTLLK